MKLILEYFKKFDMYGRRIDVYINSSTMVRSKFGAFVSIVIICVCFFIFINNFLAWSKNQNLQIIPSTQSYTIQEILKNNQTFEYTLDYSNYNIYFLISAILPDGTTLYYDDLKKYFVQKMYYRNEIGEQKQMEFENCYDSKKNVFLLEQADENINETNISNKTICIPGKIKMGLFPRIEKQMVFTPNIFYSINLCKNSSENNYSCASYEEMNEIIKYVVVQVSFPQTIYDFKKTNSPRKRIYDYKQYLIDPNFVKAYLANIIPSFLYTDTGIFQTNYELDSVDYNLENLQLETISKYQGIDIVFNLCLVFGTNKQIYYRKNDKLFDIFANIGGFINILFIIGKFICSSYNLFLLKHKLINITFLNLERKRITQNLQNLNKSKRNEPSTSFSFSLFAYMCPKIYKNISISKAIKSLYEYMDIRNIIKRLQDIDKLKMVLFDENQRNIFEIIPKPGIQAKKVFKSSIWTIDSVLETKKATFQKDNNETFNFLLNGDPINKRMYNLLDPVIKSEIKSRKEGIISCLNVL